jgi:hypothetical protein
MICHMVWRAARVQAGGRLVEEDDARVGDQAHREVEPTPQAAGLDGGGLRRRVGADQGREDLDDRGLAGAVGPSSANTVPSATSGSMPSSTMWSP